ncbi:MAG: hypothetical protein UY48_C0003G0093 [Candidatus Gottesmanbacteria bacterium GW2011_GWB1_49_7]|uniref:Uncharacterized protein n=1 Tax=Candidatus Gottesmanbacteria bacterium GW2011_GWB1_49_7 TaxID=1618448 RepID=A0A0G1W3E0_9BACT|nr:MAG: hypothetical protein UY48_C0003G0093 [Candidatus Gottesmanbacteria bacterium GW2011_GWB1_49_7]
MAHRTVIPVWAMNRVRAIELLLDSLDKNSCEPVEVWMYLYNPNTSPLPMDVSENYSSILELAQRWKATHGKVAVTIMDPPKDAQDAGNAADFYAAYTMLIEDVVRETHDNTYVWLGPIDMYFAPDWDKHLFALEASPEDALVPIHISDLGGYNNEYVSAPVDVPCCPSWQYATLRNIKGEKIISTGQGRAPYLRDSHLWTCVLESDFLEWATQMGILSDKICDEDWGRRGLIGATGWFVQTQTVQSWMDLPCGHGMLPRTERFQTDLSIALDNRLHNWQVPGRKRTSCRSLDFCTHSHMVLDAPR